jgi:hypothetical protein
MLHYDREHDILDIVLREGEEHYFIAQTMEKER